MGEPRWGEAVSPFGSGAEAILVNELLEGRMMGKGKEKSTRLGWKPALSAVSAESLGGSGGAGVLVPALGDLGVARDGAGASSELLPRAAGLGLRGLPPAPKPPCTLR